MDNGSGGFMEDLVFYGGGTALNTGNQQWTSRNLTFYNCNTAIFQNWNWVYTYKSLFIHDCDVGINMTQGGNVITTGSITLQDSVMTNIRVAGILTTFSTNSTPISGGTLVVDNVDFVGTPNAITYPDGTVILPGNTHVPSFIQGRAYTAYDAQTHIGNLTCYQPTANYSRVQQLVNAPPKARSLLTPTGTIYERSKPQFEGFPLGSIVSIIDYGCPSDGATDATECVQNFFNSIQEDHLAFIDHGAYVIRDTIQIPNNIKMVGEIWPLFMIDGSSPTFSDVNNPRPAFRVGNPGDVGAVEMTDIIFETLGPAPGAILMEWNLAATEQGSNGTICLH